MNFSDPLNKKLNILMVSDDFLPGATGVGMHLQIVCKELVQFGHSVTVLTSRQGDQAAHEEWEGIKIYRFFSLKIAGFYQAIPSISKIKKILDSDNFDIIHFHYLSYMHVAALLASKGNQAKKIYTYHMTEDVLTQPLFMRPFRKILKAQILKMANSMDLVISPSLKLKSQIQEQGVSKPIQYLTNPISRDFFKEKIILRTEPTRKDKFDILFVGRLNLEKNIPLLIKAFALHLKKFPKSELKIAGKGDQERGLKYLCEKLGITSQVKFLGFLPHIQLEEYYQKCQVFVLPSIIETQGIVALEAMSFSKPVIVTNQIVSAKELVNHGENGFIVDAYDASDLANCLNLLAPAEDLQKKMGGSGKFKTHEYDPQKVVLKMVSLYRKAKIRPIGHFFSNKIPLKSIALI
jgi:1,2-diacylglycerol 3-alpha-glucosyltransferase